MRHYLIENIAQMDVDIDINSFKTIGKKDNKNLQINSKEISYNNKPSQHHK